MKQRMYPLICSTMEALTLSVKDEYGVIYVDENLLVEGSKGIRNYMENNKYVLWEKTGKHGVFYIKETGPFAFNPQTHEIYDPYNSL